METTMPTTYTEAHNEGAYTLAHRWGGVPWPVSSDAERTAEHDLQELATMTALADWLQRWTPLVIHGAAMRGATVSEISAASGMDGAEVRGVWQRWANGQRYLLDQGRAAGLRTAAGLSIGDYNQAAAVLGCPAWPAN